MKLAIAAPWLVFLFSQSLPAEALENPFTPKPVQVQRLDMARTQVLAAKVLPLWRTDVVAPADGWIRTVVVDVGKRVHKDSTLVTLAVAGKSAAPPSRPLKVDAPFDGVVVARMVSPGSYLRQGAVLLTLVADEKMRVRASMTEKDSLTVREGAKASFEVEHFPGVEFEGQASAIAPWIDPSTHLREVECIVPNPEHRLVAGMAGRMSLQIEIRAKVLVVPREAVMVQKNEVYVFVVRDGKARKVKLGVGLEDRSNLEVREGLAEGDWIVLNPQFAKEGMPIPLS
jgi:multidrug efflux pump subunit AcrA (membrane-fusion protein)